MNINKVIEIEGELDEEDFQENESHENKTMENEKITMNNENDFTNLVNLEQMLKEIQNYYQKELNSALSFCENLSLFFFNITISISFSFYIEKIK